MKKWLLALCTLALIVPVSYGQQEGPGDGSGDGYGDGSHMGPGGDFEFPEEIQALKDELLAAKSVLKESRDALLASLRESGATDEEIRAALAEWHTENADAIAAARAIAEEIRAWVVENRPERPRPHITDRMRHRRAAFRENQTEVRAVRVQLENPDLTDEERSALRDEMRQLLHERKRLMRNKRADEGGVGGDRRPGG